MEKQHRFFPNTLRLQRRTLGYSQKQVARMLELHDTVPLSLWERGATLPNSANLIKLCLIYHTLPYDLYPDLSQQFRETIQLKEFEQFQTT